MSSSDNWKQTSKMPKYSARDTVPFPSLSTCILSSFELLLWLPLSIVIMIWITIVIAIINCDRQFQLPSWLPLSIVPTILIVIMVANFNCPHDFDCDCHGSDNSVPFSSLTTKMSLLGCTKLLSAEMGVKSMCKSVSICFPSVGCFPKRWKKLPKKSQTKTCWWLP